MRAQQRAWGRRFTLTHWSTRHTIETFTTTTKSAGTAKRSSRRIALPAPATGLAARNAHASRATVASTARSRDPRPLPCRPFRGTVNRTGSLRRPRSSTPRLAQPLQHHPQPQLSIQPAARQPRSEPTEAQQLGAASDARLRSASPPPKRTSPLSRNKDELEAVATTARDHGRNALVVTADMRDPREVVEAASRTLAEFGSVDVLSTSACTARCAAGHQVRQKGSSRLPGGEPSRPSAGVD